jgi:hypothetical protein
MRCVGHSSYKCIVVVQAKGCDWRSAAMEPPRKKHRQYQAVGPHMLIEGEGHDFAEIAAIYLEFGHQRESKVTP